MADLNVNDIVTWGGSSEPYQIITICMTGAGPAAFIQSRTMGYFVAVQPDEYDWLEPARQCPCDVGGFRYDSGVQGRRVYRSPTCKPEHSGAGASDKLAGLRFSERFGRSPKD